MVVNALKQRIADSSGVNVDQEMANLITLQTLATTAMMLRTNILEYKITGNR